MDQYTKITVSIPDISEGMFEQFTDTLSELFPALTIDPLDNGYHTVHLFTDMPVITAETSAMIRDFARGLMGDNIEPNITYQIADNIGAAGWLAETGRHNIDQSIGPFHLTSDPDAAHNGNTIYMMTPTAFGDGYHPTTIGCIEMMVKMRDEGIRAHHIADIGCGSGILSIVAARLWPDATVSAIDIDPESVRVTNEMAHANQCNHQITALCADGFRRIAGNFKYDLIIGNLLAGIITDMADDMMARINIENSHILLSGILDRQVADIIARFTTLSPHATITHDGWTTILLETGAK